MVINNLFIILLSKWPASNYHSMPALDVFSNKGPEVPLQEMVQVLKPSARQDRKVMLFWASASSVRKSTLPQDWQLVRPLQTLEVDKSSAFHWNDVLLSPTLQTRKCPKGGPRELWQRVPAQVQTLCTEWEVAEGGGEISSWTVQVWETVTSLMAS